MIFIIFNLKNLIFIKQFICQTLSKERALVMKLLYWTGQSNAVDALKVRCVVCGSHLTIVNWRIISQCTLCKKPSSLSLGTSLCAIWVLKWRLIQHSLLWATAYWNPDSGYNNHASIIGIGNWHGEIPTSLHWTSK